MERDYYNTAYQLDGKTIYLIWYRCLDGVGDQDGVLLDDRHRLLVFAGEVAARTFANSNGILVSDEPASIHNLDLVAKWLSLNSKTERPLRAELIDCHEFLSAWNLLDDIRRSITHLTATCLPRKELYVYDRLFWGSNLPAMTPPGEHFTPVWKAWEVRLMRRVFREWLSVLRMATRQIPP